MELEQITVHSFRNIRDASVTFAPGTNVLVGENGQGKTNLLEAIYLFACGKSFRAAKNGDLVRHGEDYGDNRIVARAEGDPFELRMRLRRQGGREILKNGIKLEKLSQFLGSFRVVLFCPEHLSLVKDGPGRRRSFMDSAICQLKPFYASLLNEFYKTEAQRSAVLKAGQKRHLDRNLLSVWDERLAAVSVKIASFRAEYAENLARLAPGEYQKISGGREVFSLGYQSTVYQEGESREAMEERYRKLLEENLPSDLRYGYTVRGVHHDDLVLQISGHPARIFASQGQQRSAVLALKLAEGVISREEGGQEPVYLLDDVLSELDEARRHIITGELTGRQVILTGTDERDFAFVDHRIRVSDGTFA
ncbi:MAG: DNA replication/repair protein RecF [Clostridia bacterium]|nr:DNA replication/repair protein RecF [Clostridia bacterium]